MRTGLNWLDVLFVINMICNLSYRALHNDLLHNLLEKIFMPKSLHLLTAIRCVHWIACSYSVPQRFARTNIAKSVAKMASARNALTGMKPMMMANVNVSWLLVSTWFVVIASQNTLPRIFLHIIYKICITIFLYKFSRYVIDTTRWWLLPSLSEHLLILPLQELFSFKFLWIYCWELD